MKVGSDINVSVDRLEWLLAHFRLRAHTFQAGPLTDGANFEAQQGVGYIHLLQAGAVRVQDTGAEPLDVTDPSAILYLSPTQTRIEPLTDATRIVCASFEFGLGSGNPLQAALPSMCHLAFQRLPGLTEIFSQLKFETDAHHCGRQSVLDRLCEIALVLILRELMDQQALEIGLLAGLADTKLHKALTAMHAEPASDWNLAGLASIAGMSRARFAVRFRTTVGITPLGYLMQWRLGLAQTQLLAGETVSVVAEEVGYGSASALSRAFHGQFKLSPSDWVKSNRPD